MRAVIQRVSQASVSIDEKKVASINEGILVLLGIETQDTKEDSEWLSNKISSLRIFSDKDGKMNKSVTE
ncbi:MAG: D-tyrosyl-tRNA(Tyr) deacylase, partial [Flavobacteriales bacterium]|nr:D-tyrosyl-tRNA(Tyr) deacylase [Flavobacteriales bacterium]